MCTYVILFYIQFLFVNYISIKLEKLLRRQISCDLLPLCPKKRQRNYSPHPGTGSARLTRRSGREAHHQSTGRKGRVRPNSFPTLPSLITQPDSLGRKEDTSVLLPRKKSHEGGRRAMNMSAAITKAPFLTDNCVSASWHIGGSL